MYSEYTSNIVKNKQGTCRNVLRLKRALHFIEVLLFIIQLLMNTLINCNLSYS